MSGNILITDEIVVDEAIWLEGNALEQGNGLNFNTGSKVKITFVNDEVDESGNATKSLFRFTKGVPYGQHGLRLSNLSIESKTLVAKNQHAIVFDASEPSNSKLSNIAFKGVTGYAIFIKGGCYFQNIMWDNLSFVAVGGCVGQSDDAWNLFCTLGVIQNLNLEGGINKISPQRTIYDFRGFRHISIDSILAEGSLDVSIDNIIAYRFGSRNHDLSQTNVSVRNLWSEWSGADRPQPINSIQIDNGGFFSIEGLYGITDVSPVKMIGSGNAILKLKDISIEDGSEFNDMFEMLNPNATVEIDGAVVESLGTFKLKNNLMLGKIKLKNIVSYFGSDRVHYGVGDNIEIYKHMPGFIKDNKFVTFRKPGTYGLRSFDIIDDTTEGRVLKVNHSNPGENSLPYFGGTVHVPHELIGSDLVIALRYKAETTDESSTLNVLSSEETNADSSRANVNVKNKWITGYAVFRNIKEDIPFLALAANTTAEHSLYISDISMLFGNTLPLLIGKTGLSDNIETFGTSFPEAGDWKKGDKIQNSNPNSESYQGWICTASGNPGVWKGIGLIET